MLQLGLELIDLDFLVGVRVSWTGGLGGAIGEGENLPPSSCFRFRIAWFGFGILCVFCGKARISMMDFWLFMAFGGEGLVSRGEG